MLYIHANSILESIKKNLPSNPIIVEAGAFTGKDSIRMAQAWPLGTIFAFEPDPLIFQELEINVKPYPNIHIFQLALSHQQGTALFWPSEHPKKPGQPSQAGSLLPPKERLNWSNITFKTPIPVQTATLSSWAQEQSITAIDFLWLDLQGKELPVMQASSDIIQRTSFIFTEVHFIEAYEGQAQYQELISWLESRGFVIIGKDFQDTSSWFFGNALFYNKHMIHQYVP